MIDINLPAFLNLQRFYRVKYVSDYYHGKRTRNIYDPHSKTPFVLSRSKVDLFLECPRCFYIDRRLGLGRPPGFPFALNTAVDGLLKKEFDTLRNAGKTHPLIEKYGVDAKPAPHKYLNEWRENFKGIRYIHPSTNLELSGAIDDLWINSNGEYIVVDYKATAKSEAVKELGDAEYHNGYRRQIEFYQWLLRNNGLKVSDSGYWVYCTGQPDNDKFDARIDFDIHLIGYEGNTKWIEPTIVKIKTVLDSDKIPDRSEGCDYCTYWYERNELE